MRRFSFAFGLMALFGAVILSLNLKILPFCSNTISCINDLSGNPSNEQSALYLGKIFEVPGNLFTIKQIPPVLGASSRPNKRIYVDETHQMLYAFDGTNPIFNFPVSTGKWNKTPTGTFKIWVKLEATRMTGGSRILGTYYDLPNVPWSLFFYNDQFTKTQGFSIHGAYWQNDFGYPSSYGDVFASVDNAKRLYDFADPQTTGNSTYATEENQGTLVTIYGETPGK